MVPNDCWSLTTGARSNQPRSNLWVFTILPSGSPSKDMVQSTQSDSLGISAWENIPTQAVWAPPPALDKNVIWAYSCDAVVSQRDNGAPFW